MSFKQLNFSEQLLIWAARKWTEAFRSGGNAHEMLRTAFRLARTPRAHIALDGLLTILLVASKRNVDIAPSNAPDINADEHRLLALIAVLQHPVDCKMADHIMTEWLPPSAVRLGRPHGLELGRELSQAGHKIRRTALPDDVPENIDIESRRTTGGTRPT